MKWIPVEMPLALSLFKPGYVFAPGEIEKLNAKYQTQTIPLTVDGKHAGNINRIQIHANGSVTGIIYEIDPAVKTQMEAKQTKASSSIRTGNVS